MFTIDKSPAWVWLVLICALAGIGLLFTKVNSFIKFIAIAGFLNCFFSSVPFASFMAYIGIILCCYYYWLCSTIEHWKPILKAVQATVFLNLIILFMQYFGHDTLLNFGRENISCYGIVGNAMQMASFSLVAAGFIIPVSAAYLFFPVIAAMVGHTVYAIIVSVLAWFIISMKSSLKYWRWVNLVLVILAISWVFNLSGQYKSFSQGFMVARVPVWQKIIEIANQRPLMGWGLGTFKVVFPALEGRELIRQAGIFGTAHNCWLQIFFETGYIGLVTALSALIALLLMVWKRGNIYCFVGLIMLALNMLVYFPTRILQAGFMVVAYLAYCEHQMKERNHGL